MGNALTELEVIFIMSNIGGYLTLLAAVIMPVYWMAFAFALPMKKKYVDSVSSKNWVWVNSVGFFGAIISMFAVLFIARYLGVDWLNCSAVAIVITGSVMMISLLYFEAYVLPGLVAPAPSLVDQTSSLHTFRSFRLIRLVGSLTLSLGYTAWGIIWIKSGRLPVWSSVCVIIGAPLFSSVFLAGNLRLVGVFIYSAELIGVALRMLRIG